MTHDARTWTLLPLLDKTTKFFTDKGLESPRVDAEILLGHLLGKKRIDLYVSFEQPLSIDEVDRFREMVRQRAAGKPVQRILGETEFYSLTMGVRGGVFIPRPETEILVDEALEWLRSAGRGEGAKIFDAGTGSGAIAVALAANCAGAEVRAVDRSPDAVACAGENAKRNGVAKRVAVEEGDSIDILARAPGSYDLVVSNPPYVTTAEMKELPVEVREHDPEEALHGGPDGLDFYRAFVPVAARALDEGGALLMEVSDTVCPGVLHLLEKEERLGEARVRKDFSGHDRVVFAQAG